MKRNDGSYRLEFQELNQNTIMLLIEPNTGDIVEANQAAINFYGYTRDVLMTMKIQDINILKKEEIREKMNHVKEEKANHFHFVHRLSNNELREVEVNSFPIENEKGKLLFSIVHDISDKAEQKLMFDSLLSDSPYGVAILDREQKIVNINNNFSELFQYSLEEIKGEKINYLVSSQDNRNLIDNNIELIYQGEIVKQEGVRKRKDGKLIEIEVLGYPILNNGLIIGVYIIYIDISKKKAYEKQLLLFRKILENNTEGVVVTDINGNVSWINNAFSEITGYTLEEIYGRKTNILKSGVHYGVFYKDMWHQLAKNGEWSGEIWNKNNKGEVYPEWLTINSIKDDSHNTTHYVGVFRDLSDKKRIDRRMSDLQQKDPLTGLYNRSNFLEKVDICIGNSRKSNEKFAIAFIDLNGFKEINSSLGHIVGDKLLIEFSNKLLSTNNDCILSRFSGDKFAVLCNSTNEEADMYNHAKKLLESIKQPFMIDSTILHITASIGISRFPENGVDGETLIRFADIAMLKAKEQNDEKICFYSEEMAIETERRFLLANQLVGAISNKELAVYYQPIFDIKHQSNIVGAEALLRWKNPVLGMIPPNEFIPLAEKTGQIIVIGEWVLEQVCKQISLWQYSGCHVIPISVNVSVKQLEQLGFSQVVLDIINRNSVGTNIIELEITESVSSGELNTIVNNLKELKSNGIRISMDDFGTGFSSLGQLDLFELDKLKIDKIFIDDIVFVSKRQSLVKSIIALAKSLGLTVVAEGIETKEQLSYLKEMGCQLGQGFLISEPLKAEEMKALLHPSEFDI